MLSTFSGKSSDNYVRLGLAGICLDFGGVRKDNAHRLLWLFTLFGEVLMLAVLMGPGEVFVIVVVVAVVGFIVARKSR